MSYLSFRLGLARCIPSCSSEFSRSGINLRMRIRNFIRETTNPVAQHLAVVVLRTAVVKLRNPVFFLD
jgi:hypothetical protein